MASLRDIRNRNKSVKNSQKITNAMKLVAAAKLRRAQEAMLAARPYAESLGEMLHHVATHNEADDCERVSHPMLGMCTARRVLLVVVCSDRGLCGAFNSNILRRADRFINENKERFEHLEVATIGRRSAEYFKRHELQSVRDYPGVFDQLTFRRAAEIARGISNEFMSEKLDTVYILYNEFKSAIRQELCLKDLLPVPEESLPSTEKVKLDYIYEDSKQAVLSKLMPRYVATLVWGALLESYAAEMGARMAAMDSATNNAAELSDKLTLQYNRARQAAITQELMEIVGGAEALQG